MNVITKRTILYYISEYPLAANSLKNWYNEFVKTDYKSFHEIKSAYGNASIISNKRVIFNIRGNHFRLIASFNFDTQAVYVIWFGSHTAYDKIDAASIKHLKNPNKQ